MMASVGGEGVLDGMRETVGMNRLGWSALALAVVLVAAYLICIASEVGFLFFLVLFSLVVLVTSIVRFEAALAFIPLTLTNPYTLVETGTHLHLSELVLLIILPVWFLRVLTSGERPDLDRRFLIPAAWLIAAAIVSISVARFLSEATNQTVRYVEVLLVLFVMMTNACRDERQIKRMLLYLIIGGLCASFVGIGQFVTGSMTRGETRRVFGLHGGGYGGLIGATILMCIGVVLYERSRVMRFWAIATIPFASLALVLSQTRAWIGSVGAVLLFLLMRTRRKVMMRVLAGILVIAGLIAFLVQTDGFGLVPKEVVDNAMKRAFAFVGSSRTLSSEDLSIYLRLNVWLHALQLFFAHPLTGIGVGSLRIEDYFTGRLGRPVQGVGYVDNQYLQFFAEAGTVAGCAWLLFMLRGFRMGMASSKASEGTTLHAAAFAFLGSFLVWMVGSFFWVITPHHELFALLIIYIAMLANIGRLQAAGGETS